MDITNYLANLHFCPAPAPYPSNLSPTQISIASHTLSLLNYNSARDLLNLPLPPNPIGTYRKARKSHGCRRASGTCHYLALKCHSFSLRGLCWDLFPYPHYQSTIPQDFQSYISQNCLIIYLGFVTSSVGSFYCYLISGGICR